MTHHFFDIGASSYLRSLVFSIQSAKKSVKVFGFLWMCNPPAFRFSSYCNGTFVQEYLPEANVHWFPEDTIWMYCRNTLLKFFLPITVKVGRMAAIALSPLLSNCQGHQTQPGEINGRKFILVPKDTVITQCQNYVSEGYPEHYSDHHLNVQKYYEKEIMSLGVLLKK